MSQHLIIDGYNVILRIKKVSLDENALSIARQELFHKLQAFRGTKNLQMTLVFDGQQIYDINSQPKVAGIRVVFSKPPQKADELIVDLIDSEKNPRTVVLITSDRGLMHLAKLRGCECWSVEQFLNRQTSQKSEYSYREKYETRLTSEEVEEWMALFSRDQKNDSRYDR